MTEIWVAAALGTSVFLNFILLDLYLSWKRAATWSLQQLQIEHEQFMKLLRSFNP